MFKNTASQSVTLWAVDATTGLPKTGDSANMVFYVSKDDGTVTAIASASGVPTECDSTNAKGDYKIALSQSETNADKLRFSGKSSTSNVVILPQTIYTVPSAFGLVGGAAGGVMIAGSNAATTFASLTVTAATTLTGNVSMAAGLNITQSASNTSALVITGNGTGHGIISTSGSGATGDGIKAVSAATNGNALNLAGVGTGAGLLSTGGATGIGISAVGGATSGDGLSAVATTSGHGLTVTGVGTTKHGIKATGGSTTSHGISATGGGVGHGILATSGAGATGDGIRATAASTNGNALNLVGVGTGAGLLSTGGATGHGISGVGGATSGNGIRATGTAGNSVAINAIGQGSAAGILSTGGATGHGISAVGGATSGSGISSVASTSGHGIVATGVGTTQHGINATGGSTTSHGISATGGGVGHGILATSGSGATGDGIRATAASTNGNGFNLLGVGTGAGLLTTGGATGIGLSAVGGATLGDAIKAVTTSGHGLNLAPVGSNAHGIFVTGGNGATSDGIKAVAGTGGVPIRGDITGNITGTLSTVTTLTNLPAITANWLTNAGIAADTGLQSIRSSTAQAGGGTSITLDASASATTDYYKNDLIYITGGTGVGQSRFCTAYNGTTKVATVNSAWATNPDNTSTFAIIPFDSIPGATAPSAATVATAVWTDLLAGTDFSTAASIGKLIKDYLDAAISSRMATFTLPTNFSALAITPGGIVQSDLQTIKTQTVTCSGGVTVPAATLASTSNITTIGAVSGTVGSVTGNVGGNVVGSVGSVTGLTVSNLDVAVSSRMATYAQPTGFLAATFPTTVASTTNITAASGVSLSTAGLAAFFTTNSGTTYPSAVAGSVVKEIVTNASGGGGGSVTVSGYDSGQDPATLVLDALASNHNIASTIGAKINSAAAAGDPLASEVPGSYPGGTAGYVLGQIGSGEVTFAGPVIGDDDSFEVIQGDDYLNADSRALSWTFGASPNLTGATVVMRINTPVTTVLTGTVTGEGTSAQVVKFDIPRTTTETFDVRNYRFDIQVTLADASVETPVQGIMRVVAQV